MKISKLYLIGLACLGILGCRSDQGKNKDFFLPRDSQTDNAAQKKAAAKKQAASPAQSQLGLVEAIMRRFVSDAATTQKTRPSTVYLSFTSDQRDPDAVFVQKSNINGVQVKPLSAAAAKAPGDRAPAKGDVFLGIEKMDVDELDPSMVRATCSWSSPNAERRYFTYQVRWEKNKWLVQ